MHKTVELVLKNSISVSEKRSVSLSPQFRFPLYNISQSLEHKSKLYTRRSSWNSFIVSKGGRQGERQENRQQSLQI